MEVRVASDRDGAHSDLYPEDQAQNLSHHPEGQPVQPVGLSILAPSNRHKLKKPLSPLQH